MEKKEKKNRYSIRETGSCNSDIYREGQDRREQTRKSAEVEAGKRFTRAAVIIAAG